MTKITARRTQLTLAGGALFVTLANSALAEHESWGPLGYFDLIDRLGEATPTGAGVITCEIEPVDEELDYGPKKSASAFDGKTFYEMSGPTGTSQHANRVGSRQYGTELSIAPGITDIYLYEANSWLSVGFLNALGGSSVYPDPWPDAISTINASWIGTFGNVSLDNGALRRIDWMVNRDQIMFINGINNGGGPSYPLLSHAYNAISVGIVDGSHTSVATSLAYDGGGRLKPEIVGPEDYSSFATPMVNATASLMVETARTDIGLSKNANAERSEVIKAVILASAVHEDEHDSNWSNNPATSGPDRGLTTQPIDDVVGVGTVNVNRAHLVITGGEQDGTMSPPATTNISWRGWDLATVDTSESVYYRINVPAAAAEVSILTTWHRRVLDGFLHQFVADFDLQLWRVGPTGALEPMIGDAGLFAGGNVASESAVDNVEHLYITGLTAGQYVIEVQRVDLLDLDPSAWEVATAWLFSEPPDLPGDVNSDGVVGFADLLDVLAAWGVCSGCPEDITGDGIVGFDDVLVVLTGWS